MTTALAAIALVILALLPLAIALRRDHAGRDRRDAAMALHRGQLAELDRDLADGRLAETEYAAARLEVQRRLLAASELAPTARRSGPRAVAFAVPFVVPLVAALLYMIAGQPRMPAMPLSARMALADQQGAQTDTLIRTLRDRLAKLDQKSEIAREGYILLGNAEEGRGNLQGAADAWRRAVVIRFEPDLAAMAAEARTMVEGGLVDAEAADLFARALAAAPKDAPWRETAQKRLSQTGLR